MTALTPRRWHALHTEAVQRALGSSPRARSEHFVLHCVPATALVPELPTISAPESDRSVDNMAAASTGVGFVIPKRWVRHAVTRNLIRRQMREAARRHEQRIAFGATVLLRQRATFDRAQFTSAGSVAMRKAVRAELDRLFAQLPTATS